MEILGKIIAGLLFVSGFGGWGVYFLFFQTKGFIKTTAVITGIKTHSRRRSGKTYKEHNVYVEYTVDGVVYNSKSDSYSPGYHKGKTIPIYYDPKDPNKIHGESKFLGVILLLIAIFGIAATVSSIIF